jgi:hypothetical protein
MRSWFMITCQESHRLLSERMDRPLGRLERWRLAMHLGICRVCSRVGRQMELMRAAMRRLGT